MNASSGRVLRHEDSRIRTVRPERATATECGLLFKNRALNLLLGTQLLDAEVHYLSASMPDPFVLSRQRTPLKAIWVFRVYNLP